MPDNEVHPLNVIDLLVVACESSENIAEADVALVALLEVGVQGKRATEVSLYLGSGDGFGVQAFEALEVVVTFLEFI